MTNVSTNHMSPFMQTDEFSKIEEDIDLGGDSFGVAESDREQRDILPMDEEKVKQLEAEIESLQVDSCMLGGPG